MPLPCHCHASHCQSPQVLSTTTEDYLPIESNLAQQAKEAYVALTAQERLQRQATPLGRVGPQLPGSMGPSHITQLFPGSYMLRRVQLQQYMQQLTLTLGLSKTVCIVCFSVLWCAFVCRTRWRLLHVA